jgi:hypothetical protein
MLSPDFRFWGHNFKLRPKVCPFVPTVCPSEKPKILICNTKFPSKKSINGLKIPRLTPYGFDSRRPHHLLCSQRSRRT